MYMIGTCKNHLFFYPFQRGLKQMPTTTVIDCCKEDQCRGSSRCFYRKICELYLSEVYRFCMHLIKNQSCFKFMAEECTQDTFVAARQQLVKLKHHPNVKGWLYLTAKNLIYKSFRCYYTQKKHETTFECEKICSFSNSVEEEWENCRLGDVDTVIVNILMQLSNNEYILYEDYFCRQLAVPLLATKYNISVTATTTRIYRLKRKLRTLSHQYCLTHI
ncbi:sigma-70 family RNA polymerase sigma factor [Paenibacillus polymyxa]|uniref:RNA polymerase sigma factor n=1 Tax=Paenibacillus polymyxa TaxID=1406 RepID=UPI00295AD83E|nr:sigma-70 family RNA polymerase sigma factor [Paenibacillus polymyxa]